MVVDQTNLEAAKLLLLPIVNARVDRSVARQLPRTDVARDIKEIVAEVQRRGQLALNLLEARDLVTLLVNDIVVAPVVGTTPIPQQTLGLSPEPVVAAPDPRSAPPSQTSGVSPQAASTQDDGPAQTESDTPQKADQRLVVVAVPTNDPTPPTAVDEAKLAIQPLLLERIDVAAASQMPRIELARQIGEIVDEIREEQRLRLNLAEQRDLVTMLINDMLGLGPLEPLLDDETITDIMINGPYQVYVERKGKLERVNVRFRDDAHVLNIASRIVNQVGRRIDESSPLADARLADGSRVNIVIPPLALDGPTISIRKFAKKSITLDIMANQNNISEPIFTVLKVAARSQLNVLISGGTGSGKTTLLNAMSQIIDHGERIVTIEDAAELQLQQPHVVRLETRPPNLEGHGAVNMRDLLKNALRMRPDRIILGEVRGSEAVDMLQAMNTGHEGSMCTIHANTPRDALTRLENMVGLAGINLPSKAVRNQIAAAIELVVQVSRMRDGKRRVISLTEVVGMEEDVITTQELFRFDFEGEDVSGALMGKFVSARLRPHFITKAEYFGLDRILVNAI